MDYEIIKTDLSAGVATVTISRPAALNALNARFFREMDAWLDETGGRTDVKAVVLTGEGKAFAAGADIAEMSGHGRAEALENSRVGGGVFAKIGRLPQPVIAAVNGFALGGGCELALACDIRIASAKAKFGQPEVNLGLTPGYAGTQRLPRLIGLGNALYLLLTGEMIGAEEALRMGLVQKVVEPEALLSTAFDTAALIAGRGPAAVRLVKQVARQGLLDSFEAGSRLETEAFASLFEGEGCEGMKAFLEKRKPVWPA